MQLLSAQSWQTWIISWRWDGERAIRTISSTYRNAQIQFRSSIDGIQGNSSVGISLEFPIQFGYANSERVRLISLPSGALVKFLLRHLVQWGRVILVLVLVWVFFQYLPDFFNDIVVFKCMTEALSCVCLPAGSTSLHVWECIFTCIHTACTCVCVCSCVCARRGYVGVYIYIYMHTCRVFLCTCIYLRACMPGWHVCVHIYWHTCIPSLHVYVYMFTCMYAEFTVCVCISTYVHTEITCVRVYI